MNNRKVWLITGTSSGLGRALAEEALAKGEYVVATARNPDTIKDLTEQYPESAHTVKLDVTKTEDIKTAVVEAKSKYGAIDVVVNNAGYGLVGALEEPSDNQIRELFETNLFGVITVIRETLPVMRSQKRGHILNIL
jgi:NADP-dependent 3-hydroxy acid dehydrogenase YdfG